MAKPSLFTVDDDAEVLRAVERDLRRHYGDRYRVLRADSGAAALEALRQLKLRNEVVALFLVDQRMPRMSGVEFLEQAKPLFPEAKRVLLTAYADTDAAIRAINQVQLDYYLMKPWDPPDEHLYPVVDDLLDDWQADFRPPFEGVRLLGHRWSPASHQIRDFLSRNQVPYQWLDVEGNPEAAQLLAQAGLDSSAVPVVLLADGNVLARPTTEAVAEKIGMRTRAEKPFYDLVVVGAGPAGLAAAVYGASEGLNTAVIEREAPGGQAGISSRIENYLGFPSGLSGAQLARRAVDQAKNFKAEIITPRSATGLRANDPYRIITLSDGSELSCNALLVATGVSYRHLDVPGIDALTGAGVFYGAAMTEALACKDEDVYVVGGANSAGQAAMYFARYARRVTMLVRGESLAKSMSQYLIDQISQTPNIEIRPHSQVVAVGGEGHLETVTILGGDGTRETVRTGALFIFIGAQPHTDWLAGVVERDERGFILAGPDLLRGAKRPRGWNLDRDPFLLETSLPGVFVAGDVRHGSVKRVASGVGEGSIAVQFIHQYLSHL